MSRRAFDRAVDQGKILLSFPALEELDEVLRREKFRKYFDEDEANHFLAALVQIADWIEISTKITACRDPRDDKFLELAVSGQATHLITGDKDLLALNPFRGVRILTPDDFLLLL